MINGFEAVTTESSITRFLAREPETATTNLIDVYCPWSIVDYFGRSHVLETFEPGILADQTLSYVIGLMFPMETLRL